MHERAHTHEKGRKLDRTNQAKRVTVIGSMVNLALAGGKLAAGIMGGSSAMIADALHSLSDLVTDIMVYVSISIAAHEADDEHPYGHGRAETIGAFATGAALVIVALVLIFEMMEKLMEAHLPVPTWPALAAAVVSIGAKEALYHYTYKVGRQSDNSAIIANAWHHRTDAISSIAAMVGIGGAMMGFPLLDPIAAILVVFMILKVGVEICWGALQELMDVSATPEKLEELVDVIRSVRGVVSFHELKTRKLGGDLFVDVHIQVQPDISISEAHNIAETVRYKLKGKSGATDALVHIDAEEDLEYKIIRTSRDDIESRVRQMALEIEGVTGVSKLIIHYLGGETFVEFNVDIDDSMTIGGAKTSVARLRDTITTQTPIAGAVISARLMNDNLETD